MMNTIVKRELDDAREHWLIIDKLTHADGSVEEFEHHNIVCDGLAKTLGALLFGSAGYNNTIYMAVGTGSATWDSTPVAPTSNEVKLTAELFRKQITSKSFQDASGADVATVTNRIRFTVDFSEAEAVGDLREFALFSGNATATKDSGFMINKKHTTKIPKTNTDLLSRTVIVII